MINKHYCAKCEKETEFKYYDGYLGYKSFKCVVCDFDINEFTALDLDKLYSKLKGGLK